MFDESVTGAIMTYCMETEFRPMPDVVRTQVRGFTGLLQKTVPAPWHFPSEKYPVERDGTMMDRIPIFPDGFRNYEVDDPRDKYFWMFSPRLNKPHASVDFMLERGIPGSSQASSWYIIFRVFIMGYPERLDNFLSHLFGQQDSPVPVGILSQDMQSPPRVVPSLGPVKKSLLRFSVRHSSGLLFFGTNEEDDPATDIDTWPDQMGYVCLPSVGVLRMSQILSVTSHSSILMRELGLRANRKSGPLTRTEQARLATHILAGHNDHER